MSRTRALRQLLTQVLEADARFQVDSLARPDLALDGMPPVRGREAGILVLRRGYVPPY